MSTKDLQSFIRGLGFAKIQQEDASDDEIVDAYANKPDDMAEQSRMVGTSERATSLRFSPASQWYAFELPQIEIPNAKKSTNKPLNVSTKTQYLKSLFKHAQSLAQDESRAYEQHKMRTSASDFAFFKTVCRSGTLNDRISALSLAAQESPLHTLTHLETLMTFARKKSRRESIQAIDALVEMFVSSILPNRKLAFFAENAGLDQILTWMSKYDQFGPHLFEKHLAKQCAEAVKISLIFWYAEDFIKTKYYELITILEKLLHDTVQHTRSKCMIHVYTMLSKKPEQERTLLALLANKLGDLDRQISSKAVHLLKELLVTHAGMKSVVIAEIERIVFRNGTSERCRYCALVMLSQIMFSKTASDMQASRSLLNLYLSLFQDLVSSHQIEKNSKNAAVTRQAGVGIESKTIAAILTGIVRAIPFAVDEQDPESLESLFEKHLDALFKLMHMSSVSIMTSIQALQIVGHLLWRPSKLTGESDAAFDDSAAVFSPKLTSRFFRALYASLLSERHLLTAKHFAIFLNLLFKSMSQDPDPHRVLAFIKRLIQCGASGVIAGAKDTGFLCGALVVINEVIQKRSDVKSLFVHALAGSNSEDDGLENFKDDDAEPSEIQVEGDKMESYDPMNRSPEFCHAEKSFLWDLLTLVSHYHPTVSLFANKLIEGSSIRYPSDPLQDFTMIRFLDRFVYRNPKDISKDEETKNKPKSGISSVLRQTVDINRSKDIPVNTREWMSRYTNGAQVPADERFFYTYFELNKKNIEAPASEPQDNDMSDEEVDRAIMDSFGDMTSDVEEDDNEVSEEEEYEMDSESDLMSAIEEESDVEIQDPDETADEIDSDNETEVLESWSPATKKRRGSLNSIVKNIQESSSSNVFASADDFKNLLDEADKSTRPKKPSLNAKGQRNSFKRPKIEE